MSDQMERTEMETVHPERGGEDYSEDYSDALAAARCDMAMASYWRKANAAGKDGLAEAYYYMAMRRVPGRDDEDGPVLREEDDA